MLDQFTSEQIAIGTGISISAGVTLAWLLNGISKEVSDIYYKDRTMDVTPVRLGKISAYVTSILHRNPKSETK